MAQNIINHNPEDNPRLNQIYQILLVAGYFRIRIASLKAFDKVVGGIAWCITSSNFQIQVQYNDEMQIGQKIKVSEIICDSLKKMKCPYTLQPFQLQGLDVNNIFPIVQWLVKFVYETRFERQKYDRQLSMILGKPITKLQNIGNPSKIPSQPIKRTRINRAIQKANYRNPIRVYSALLQYNDATASKMYNKLLNIMTNKNKSSSKQKKVEKENKNKKQGQNLIQLLGDENEEQNTKQQRNMNQFGQYNINDKLSLDKLQKIIMENKNSIQEGLHENQNQQEEQIKQINFDKQTQQHKDRDNQKEMGTNEQQRQIKAIKNTNKKYEQKIKILQQQLQSFQSICSQIDNQLQQIQQKHRTAQQLATKQIQKNQQYKEAEAEINLQLQSRKQKVNSKLQKLVQKRQNLKNKKVEIKKKAKTKIDQLNYQYQLAQASVPEIDEEAFKQMLKQAEIKKQIYTKKYEQLTLINQDLAILQRKAQNYTSAPEIAQYHQRFVQLFESINILIQQKRSMYSQISNLQALKKVVNNYLQIMNNMKLGYGNIKKKNQLKQFIQDIQEIVNGLDTNMKNSEAALAKIKSKRQSVYGQYMDLIKFQRDYLHLLRMLKLEYENAAKLYK